ncbi:MAG: hypothetical protein ACLGPL_09210, partial [Acidobacteriota bacterium]
GHYDAFIGETVSLIHAPIYLRNREVYDAVLNRPVAEQSEGDPLGELDSQSHPNWPIEFIPTICPHCGWDLLGEKDTLALICKNCNSIWRAYGNSLRQMGFTVVPSENGTAAIHLPFWRLRAELSRIRLDTYGDLRQLANVPRIATREREEQKLHFWIPGFKIPPHHFLRISQYATLAQEWGEGEETLPKGPIHPVTLPAREAAESIKILAASLATPPSLVFPWLPRIQVKITDYRLYYVPFRQSGGDYIQPATQIVVNRNALNLGRLL